jgi:hypothetical protein
MDMGTRITGTLPEADQYIVLRWSRDGRNHRFERGQLRPDAQAFWPKCTCGKAVPQRTCFRDELSPELGDDRDTAQDCRTCFATVREPRRRIW